MKSFAKRPHILPLSRAWKHALPGSGTERDRPFKRLSSSLTITARIMGASRFAGFCRLPLLLPGRRITQQFCREGTFYDNLAKQADPSRLSDRAKRDEELTPEIERVFEENLKVYGVRKIWHQTRR